MDIMDIHWVQGRDVLDCTFWLTKFEATRNGAASAL